MNAEPDRREEDSSLARFAGITLAGLVFLLLGLQILRGFMPAASKAGNPLTTLSRVSIHGIGPVIIGMTVDRASESIGRALRRTDKLAASEDCFYVEPEGGPEGISFMVVHGKIARVDITNPEIQSRAGAKLGSTEKQVHSLYRGRIQVEHHQYDEKGHYLIFTPKDPGDKGYRMIFETNGKIVTTFRAGTVPEVQFVEHCL
ncbi:MAG TPA: hypothetical protein VH988_24055 [Thermoanaerobaculia bacterium]|nr:hypothetical protein [Thermoanaerobaculia bacterium]